MSFINNVEMAKALFQKSCIKVEKAFFGLQTKVIYTLTNSPVVGDYQEYDTINGRKIKYFLELPSTKLAKELQKGTKIEPAENGVFSLCFCYSKDHQFAAFLLSQYIEFDYCPVSDIRFVQGGEAEALLHALSK